MGLMQPPHERMSVDWFMRAVSRSDSECMLSTTVRRLVETSR
jgi:hypothetical protein